MPKVSIPASVLTRLARSADRGYRLTLELPEALTSEEVSAINSMFLESVRVTLETD